MCRQSNGLEKPIELFASVIKFRSVQKLETQRKIKYVGIETGIGHSAIGLCVALIKEIGQVIFELQLDTCWSLDTYENCIVESGSPRAKPICDLFHFILVYKLFCF